MKFAFSLSTVVEADSQETALSNIANHIATMARHIANERKLADCGAKFTLTLADDVTEAVDVKHDPVVAEHGPIPLDLDPESPEGIVHAEQLAQAEAAAQAAEPEADKPAQ